MPRMAYAEAASRMQEEQFEAWLRVERALGAGTVRSRISNCKRVERHENDLDCQYDADGLAGLLDRLDPSRPEHTIPIDGDVFNGTATLRSAVRIYRDFRNAGAGADGSTGAPVKRRSPERGHYMNRTEAKSAIANFLNTVPDKKQRSDLQAALNAATAPAGAHWPAWPQPNDRDLLDLALAMAPFTRFLDPDVVGAVVEDNRLMRAEWSTRLEALGIDPAIYLWEGSPCAFPGVRRYAGKERESFRQRAAPSDCLALDDNDYPKHLWAFVLTGKPFRPPGPDGYQLAHLFDHKKHGNRWRDELVLPSAEDQPPPLYGLFTSAANAIYTSVDFLRPTDGSPRLRSIIQWRAQQLYSDRCCLVPPPLEVTSCDDPDWAPSNFQWGASVGGTDHIGDFLAFRRKQMDELIDKRQADAPR